MTGGVEGWRGGLLRQLLRGDSAGDLLRIVGLAAGYAAIDVLTRAIAGVPDDAATTGLLLWRSIAANPVAVVALVALLGLVSRLGRGDLFGTWSSVERGQALRALAMVLVVFTTWESACYEYNFLLGQWHVFDRLAIVALAIGVWFRPIVLVPFALQARIVAEQFVEPFGTTAGANIGELLLIALLVIAAMHLVVALTDRAESAPVVLVLGAAIATHFFVPGLAKARLGWAGANDPGNFAINAYTAGWLGRGDGGWARTLADVANDHAWIIVFVTLLAELCAFVAVYHRKLLRWWLPLWAVFQLSIFAISGFFLVGWIVLELALLTLLLWPGSDDWLRPNDTPARGLIAVGLVVLAGPVIFHPPRLAWIDAPVGYGYEVDAVGASGERYTVPLTAFAPFQQELSLGFAQFRETRNVVGGYGAADSLWLADELAMISNFDELAAFESGFEPTSTEVRRRSEELVVRWFDSVNQRGDPAWFPLSPVAHYWVSRPGREFDFQEPIESVTIVQVVTIHGSDRATTERTQVLVVVADESGDARVAARS